MPGDRAQETDRASERDSRMQAHGDVIGPVGFPSDGDMLWETRHQANRHARTTRSQRVGQDAVVI